MRTVYPLYSSIFTCSVKYYPSIGTFTDADQLNKFKVQHDIQTPIPYRNKRILAWQNQKNSNAWKMHLPPSTYFIWTYVKTSSHAHLCPVECISQQLSIINLIAIHFPLQTCVEKDLQTKITWNPFMVASVTGSSSINNWNVAAYSGRQISVMQSVIWLRLFGYRPDLQIFWQNCMPIFHLVLS